MKHILKEKNRKKILPFTLTFMLIMSLFMGFFIVTLPVLAQDFAGGTGTSTDPYQITHIDHLYNVRNDITAYYILMNDLDFENIDHYLGADTEANRTDNITGTGWTKILSGSDSFTGCLDGDGFTISNLFMNATGETNVGLIRSIGTTGIVKNLGFYEVNITGKSSIGTLCGLSYGTILNVFVDGGNVTARDAGEHGDRVGGLIGVIYGGYVNDSYANVDVYMYNGTYAGGFVGRLTGGGTVSRCFALGDVYGRTISESWVAGLVSGFIGAMDEAGSGLIKDCYARGNVTRMAGGYSIDRVTGFVGMVQAGYTVNNSYSTGNVTFEGATDPTNRGFAASVNGDLEGCFWDNQTSQQLTSEGDAVGLNTSAMTNLSNFTAAGWDIAERDDWDGETWYIVSGDTYPLLQWSDMYLWGHWGDGWTIARNHTVETPGYTYGNWSHSEHFAEGLGPEGYDEYWSYSNASVWSVEDHSSWWTGNATFEVDMNLTNHAFAVLNSSAMNRLQSFGWLHMNQSEYEPIWPYIIFAYNNSQDFYVVAFTPMGGGNPEGVWLMHWNGTNMTNLNGTPIIDPYIEGENLFNQDADYALGDYKLPEGAFYKLIYNSKSAYIDFKCWWDSGVAMSEPAGWLLSDDNATLQHPDTPMGYGIGVWNPYEVDAQVQWDLINLWQINRTVNESATITIDECDPAPRPHMEFPVFNMTLLADEYWAHYDNSTGNLTGDDIRDIMLEFTNMFNLETITGSSDQFDNIYYYSALLTDVHDFLALYEGEEMPSWIYDEYLYIHVQMCPESGISWEEMVVGIDVDDDGTWDSNDRMFFMYYDPIADDVTYDQFNGDYWMDGSDILGTIWVSASGGVNNMHRYNSHLNYQIMIPLAELVKDDGHSLNASDVFGLSISNTMAYLDFEFSPYYTWQDYNESDESTCYPPILGAFNYFYGEMGPDPNLTAWGEGVITDDKGEWTPSGETIPGITITKTANISSVPPGSTYALVNYTITINNTGTTHLTNVVINDTRFNCTCHDFHEEQFLTVNLSLANLTNHSCYREFAIGNLSQGQVVNLWYTINLTNCTGVTEGQVLNTATVNATQLDTAVSTTNIISWGVWATQVHVVYQTYPPTIDDIASTVFAIIGIIFIIGAILLIVVVVRNAGLF